jgi:hypothetical protein
MDTPTTRILRPSRIVALVLIALAVVGLAYLRYRPSDSTVSVPSAAKAGDLTLESSEYATASRSYAADWPITLDSWLSAAEGNTSGLWFRSLFADLKDLLDLQKPVRAFLSWPLERLVGLHSRPI